MYIFSYIAFSFLHCFATCYNNTYNIFPQKFWSCDLVAQNQKLILPSIYTKGVYVCYCAKRLLTVKYYISSMALHNCYLYKRHLSGFQNKVPVTAFSVNINQMTEVILTCLKETKYSQSLYYSPTYNITTVIKLPVTEKLEIQHFYAVSNSVREYSARYTCVRIDTFDG